MKVDFHVHVEEGPYSLDWLMQTTGSLSQQVREEVPGTREWMDGLVRRLTDRMKEGPYSSAWLDAYRSRAKELGIGIVGIVEHGYRFTQFKSLYEAQLHLGQDHLGRVQRQWLDQVCCECFSDYLAFLERERKRWEDDGIALRIGIELDFFPEQEAALSKIVNAYDWDFCLGAVHFVEGVAVHLPQTSERFGRMDPGSLYSRYFDRVEQTVESGLFDLIAHVDGLKSCGYRPEETSLLSYYQRIARSLKRNQVATELNTTWYRHPTVGEMSPSPRMLEILAQHGVEVTTASGATRPDEVGNHGDMASAMLKRAGFESITVFEQRRRKLLPL